MTYKILVINPGSTSTKISIFEGEREVFTKVLRHSMEEINAYDSVADQFDFRRSAIMAALEEAGLKPSDLTCVVGRGGLLRPVPSGVIEINARMLEELRDACYGEHASNLGGMLAHSIASLSEGCHAYIADPVVVDEMSEVAHVGGHPLFPRISIFHALNHKMIARVYAQEIGQKYEDLRLVVAHLGGGVSVAAHEYGKVVDVNNALAGEGPFSPERSGGIVGMYLAELCFSGKYTLAEIKKLIAGKGGIVAHLGTNSFKEVDDRVAAGDPKARLISDAFVHQVCKEIGAMSTVLSGRVDAILLTGGVAYGKALMKQIEERVSFIAPVRVYPGEDEMRALALNAIAVMEGRQEVLKY